MSEPTLWWILAGLAVGVELVTGTFYLLMVAIGMAAAAVAAHLGASTTAQLVVAAVVGGGAVAVWHVLRGKEPAGERASANKNVNLDIGETVHVDAWSGENTCNVQYRGAQWAATLASGERATTGAHRIVEVIGNRLVLKPA